MHTGVQTYHINLAGQSQHLNAIGDVCLLQSPLLAVFCSVKCPASIILKAHDFGQILKAAGTNVISGFHSPIEQEVLTVLLRGEGGIVVCPARNIEDMRITAEWKPHIDSGRLAIVSIFEKKDSRITQRTADARNQFVAALGKELFVAYAEPGGRTETLCKTWISRGKSILTFDSPYTKNLIEMGAIILK
jgi:predicted Rossmann fold nucleotide-binding protein DprA/Smf involved in DNA uptake